jgi:hypothetical protein
MFIAQSGATKRKDLEMKVRMLRALCVGVALLIPVGSLAVLGTGVAGASTSISSGTFTLGPRTATLTSGNTITFATMVHGEILTANATTIIKFTITDTAKTSGTIYTIKQGAKEKFTSGGFTHCVIATLPRLTAIITATAKTVTGSASDAGYSIVSTGGTCSNLNKTILTADLSGKTIAIKLTY